MAALSLAFADLSTAQQAFVCEVLKGLSRHNADDLVSAVYGDGSASPHGEKFAAARGADAWRVVFDFGTGRCHHASLVIPA